MRLCGKYCRFAVILILGSKLLSENLPSVATHILLTKTDYEQYEDRKRQSDDETFLNLNILKNIQIGRARRESKKKHTYVLQSY
jgi:hypothetical protein